MELNKKYRPKFFKDVVGHQKKIEILKGYIKKGSVSSLFLFSGVRGIGKTTLARLFAKGLNCKNFVDDVCGVCDSCISIDKGESFSIIEIDGASNRGIDDMKRLRELAQFKGMDRYKVFIIDEAGMLTKEAWNAGLKLLEEAPKGVVFMLATTEKEKIIDTILSRAIEIELLPLTSTLIRNRLKQIIELEKFKVSDLVVDKIVENSKGIMRDAINSLESVAVLDKDVTLDDLKEIKGELGIEEKNFRFKVCKAFVGFKMNDILEIVTYISEKGISLKDLIKILYDGIVGSYLYKKLGFYPQYIEGIEVSEKDCQLFLDLFPVWYRLFSDYPWDYQNLFRFYADFLVQRSK